MKSIFIRETPIYRKVRKSLGIIKVFEGRRVRVGTEMRAMVASWGLLLHDEGAWGAVRGCRGLFGRQFFGSRVQKKKFENFGEPSKRLKSAKRTPQVPPKSTNKEPKRASKTPSRASLC